MGFYALRDSYNNLTTDLKYHFYLPYKKRITKCKLITRNLKKKFGDQSSVFKCVIKNTTALKIFSAAPMLLKLYTIFFLPCL